MPESSPSEKLVSISAAARILAVSIDTVRRWERKKLIASSRSAGGHRLFAVSELEDFKNNKPYSISEAAHFLGVSASTLRRYEERGFLIPKRNEHGERVYGLGVLRVFKDRKKERVKTVAKRVEQEGLPVVSAEALIAPALSSWSHKPQHDPIFSRPVSVVDEKPRRLYIEPNNVTGKKEIFIKVRFRHIAVSAAAVLAVVVMSRVLWLSGARFSGNMSFMNEPLAKIAGDRFEDGGQASLQFAGVPDEGARVLAVTSEELDSFLEVNVPSFFNAPITADGMDINLGSGRIFASNIVNSLQGQVGDLNLQAGEGIAIDGLTITNTAMGLEVEPQDAFQTVKVGSDEFAANEPDEILTVAGSGSTTVSLDKNTGTLTITGTDSDTTYTAGSDLTLSGTTFSLDSVLDSVTTINGLTTVDAVTENTVEGLIFDTDAETISGVWTVADDTALGFGSDSDWSLSYAETGTDQLLLQTTNTAATATSKPMFEILVGTTPTANQQVFGIAKGTTASRTPIFTVDEDGDVGVTGTTTLNGQTYTWPSADGDSYYVLSTNGSGQLSWINPAEAGASGDIFSVGTCASGDCFTSGNTQAYSLYFEGATADDYEVILTAADATSSDKTITLPNATGTVILSGHTLTSDVTATLQSTGSTSVTVARINGAELGDVTATDGDLLLANGSQWASVAMSGDVGITSGGVTTIQSEAVETGTLDLMDGNSVSDEYCLTYEADGVNGNFAWQDCNATGYQSFAISDGFTSQTIESGDTITFADGAGIDVAVSATDTVTVALSHLGLQSLSDPGTDSMFFWDESVDASAWLAPDGTILQISGTTLQVASNSLNFSELSNDLALDASTTITADGTEVLTITNTGSGNSFVVNDEAGDATPFVINASGNVSVGGDLTISGDDLFMTTNTLGAVLVADGTNFNPVVMSGDITVAVDGVTTIANDAVELTTQTTGNYVATIANADGGVMTVANGTSEGGAVTLDITDNSLDFTELSNTLALDASTTITADGTEVLTITNTGSGNS
ncbi:MAG: MerR family DNA-binding transcriptional regulator, partial [Candidatus Andersenbacteria bacterium]|nr:MerR family DNA-binding transcriptional regulator [Candidatus Andersenbacteria bacterium]